MTLILKIPLISLKLSIILYFFIEKSTGSSKSDTFCTIHTENGVIRGLQNQTLFENQSYFSFRGIPFAKPPIKGLRFKAPQKTDPWNNTFDAFDFGNDCIQPDSENNLSVVGSEDCLYLNVFVPTDCATMSRADKLPVLVYIYGGRMAFGSGRHYAPDFFMDTNVIVVTFNYRLGPFGFLSLNSSEYSGNMGMKDQVLALKWVNENIERFGGNKNRVTVMGHSSGGVSADLHMISSQSKHLFQKAIVISGSALDPLMPTRGEHSSILYDLAKTLDRPIKNESDLITFLNDIDGGELVQKTFREFVIPVLGRKSFDRVWNVIIEDPNAVDPFLTQTPFDILTNDDYESNFDTLYAFSPKELTSHREQKNFSLLKAFDDIFEIELPLEMAQLNFTSDLYKEISTKIREFYFNGSNVTTDGLSKLLSDVVFLYGIDLSARIQAVKSKGLTYYAEFTAENKWNASARRSKASNYTINYSQHFDQLFYIFRLSVDPELVSDEDYRNLTRSSLPWTIIKSTTDFYANFVKSSNPVPQSKPHRFNPPGLNQLQFFDIRNNGIFNAICKNRQRIEFWDNLFNDYKQHWNTRFNFTFL